MAVQLRLYRVLMFFHLLEYNLSVGLLLCTLVRNATVRHIYMQMYIDW